MRTLREPEKSDVLGLGEWGGWGALLVGSVLCGHLCKAPSSSRSAEMPLAAPSHQAQSPESREGEPIKTLRQTTPALLGPRVHGLETPERLHPPLGISPDSHEPCPQLEPSISVVSLSLYQEHTCPRGFPENAGLPQVT